jgi:hypothetical protein
MCDTLNDLSKYYFDKFNVIFKSDKHTDDSLSNHQAFILIEFIKQYYNLSDEVVQFLKTNKGTLKELVDCLEKHHSQVKAIKDLVLNPILKSETLFNNPEFIDNLDPGFRANLLESLKNNIECPICIDDSIQMMYNCGHGLCNECDTTWSTSGNGKCPFCRTRIDSKTEIEDIRAYIANKNSKEEETKEETKKFTLVLGDAKIDYVESRLNKIANVSARMNPLIKQELELISQSYPEFIVNVLSKCKSEEILVEGCVLVFPSMTGKWTKEDMDISKIVGKALTNPNRVVRFLTELKVLEMKSMEKKPIAVPVNAMRFNRVPPVENTVVEKLMVVNKSRKLTGFVGYCMSNFKNVNTSLLMIKKDIYLWQQMLRDFNIRKFAYKTKKTGNVITNVQLFLLAHAITNMVKSKSRKPSGNIWDTQLSEVEAEGLNVLMTKNNLKFVNGYVQVYSVDAELNMAFEKDAIDDILELFCKNRGALYRNLRRFVVYYGDIVFTDESRLDKLNSAFNGLSAKQIVDLIFLFNNQIKVQDIDPEMLKESKRIAPNGTIDVAFHEIKPIKKEQLVLLMISLNIVLNTKTQKFDNTDLLIIDESSKLQLVNKNEYSQVPSWTDIMLTRGDGIQLNETDNIMCYIYWQNTTDGKRVDLDLTVYGLTEEFVKDGNAQCSFTQLVGFRETMRHSGDITTAPSPVAEHVKFNIKQLKNANPNVRYIIVTAFSFNSIPFEDMQHALVGVGIDDASGKGPDESDTLGVCNLVGNAKENITGIFDLSTNTFYFANLSKHKVNPQQKKSHSYENCADDSIHYIKNFIEWRKHYKQSTHYFIARNLINYDNVVLIENGTIQSFARDIENETPQQFNIRIETRRNAITLSKEELTKLMDTYAEEEKKVLYFGSQISNLPENSIVFSKWKPQTTNTVEHFTDAYLALNDFNN